MIVSVRLQAGRVSVPVVSKNHKTLWVSLADSHIIKRHKKKHGVIRSSEPKPIAGEEERIDIKLSRWKRFIQWVRKLWGIDHE